LSQNVASNGDWRVVWTVWKPPDFPVTSGAWVFQPIDVRGAAKDEAAEVWQNLTKEENWRSGQTNPNKIYC